MRIKDLFVLSLRNLLRRKVRTFLTVLGVIIGATSIIVMVSLGIGQNAQIDELSESMGGLNAVEVMPTQWHRPETGEEVPRTGIINNKTVETIEKMPLVDFVEKSEVFQGQYMVDVGRDYVYGGELGYIDPNFFEDLDISIAQGTLFGNKPSRNSIDIIVSENIGYMLYNPKDSGISFGGTPLEIDSMSERFKLTIGMAGEEMNPILSMEGMEAAPKMKDYRLNVTGVFSIGGFGAFNKPAILMSEASLEQLRNDYDELTLSKEMLQKRRRDKDRIYQSITAHVVNPEDVETVIADIEAMDLQAYSNTEFIDQMKQSGAVAQAILAGIGSISLFVAAIGITNTMVMSIYERTKEIGVMKVIGASVRDIRNMFLLEAGMIGFFGGVVGVGLSLVISRLLNRLFAAFFTGPIGGDIKISIIPLWLALAGLFFCFLIGVVTGYYPARRATKLSAIEAIRTE